MTQGHERAIKELTRLQSIDPDSFEVIYHNVSESNILGAYISIKIGLLETEPGGLELMEREEFLVCIPPDFPFDCPWVKVLHDRFAGFDHVVWKKEICLYQSKEKEWNPSDGLYGLFDRLKIWLGKAAINDMDPVDGPLEPPHHITAFSELPFVIKKDAPVQATESWVGVAEIEKYDNRIELVDWHSIDDPWPENKRFAFAIMLTEPLPMEFPKEGKDILNELSNQGIDKDQAIRNLSLAALLAPKGEPIHLVLGLPMRRAVDKTLKLHIAVWVTDSKFSELLRFILPGDADTETLKNARQDILSKLCSIIEETNVRWCKVFEERNEIIVRRDKDSPLTWLTGKKVLILGCGALGSWAGEVIARTRPQVLHLLDKSKVNAGILARQNYSINDLFSKKSEALAKRIKSILGENAISVEANVCEAHKFLTEDLSRINSYDVVVDCTASEIFQMKLERDWAKFCGNTPVMISMVIDAKAESCLSVVIAANSKAGPWDAYIQLKNLISLQGDRKDIVSAFYSDNAVKGLFQPEPGCSDPTFSGSTADMFTLVSTALNYAFDSILKNSIPLGLAFSAHVPCGSKAKMDVFNLSEFKEVTVGAYRVRINNNIERELRGWIEQNNRLRSSRHETGGLLWGLWDDAVNVIWILGVSGPPVDSQHMVGHFTCGVSGTLEEHKKRLAQSNGTNGFIGLWHTHPEMSSGQSVVDIRSMAVLVSNIGHNHKRILMFIVGESLRGSTAGIYIYESQSTSKDSDFVSVGERQISLEGVDS